MENLAVKESLMVYEATPKKDLPKGLYWIGNVIWVSYSTPAGRKRESTKTNSVKEAVNFLADRQAGIRSGRLVFENQGSKKVLFKDFVIEAIRAKGYSLKGGYSLEEALTFMGEDKQAIRKLGADCQAMMKAGKKPRFKFDSAVNYFGQLKRLLGFFGNKEMSNKGLTSDEVRKYIESRKLDVSPATINRELTTLSDCIKWGLDTDKYRDLVFRNPVSRKSHRQQEADPKQRYWTPEERELFLETSLAMKDQLFFPSSVMNDVAEWQWLTGLRIESSLSVKVGQVKLGLGRFGQVHLDSWQVKRGKKTNHSLKYVKAVEIAAKNMQGKAPDDFLFEWAGCHKRTNLGKGIEYYSFLKAFKMICAKAGIQGANIHSWKKTYAMDRAIDGATPYDLQIELQHMDASTTDRYIDKELVKEIRERRELELNPRIP